ncbi:MAG: hypothetical protein KTR30_27315 [Saprospiraceae bacterium]|nr:hypothetical protein [Saprospiraceae bacterium]
MYRKFYLFLLCLLTILIAQGQVFSQGLQAEIQMSVDDQELICDRSTIAFDDQEVGSSTERVVTITNSGKTPLIIYGYDLSGFENFSVEFEFPFEGIVYIPPGEQLSFSVIFTPGSPGSHYGSLTIQSSDPNHSTCQVSLYGLGLELNPLLLRFTDDPLAGYEEVDCGGESFFDLTEDPSDGNFRVHYSFRNQSDVPIIVRAETTVVGGTITNILNPVELAPGGGGYHGPSFFLAAGDIYTILTTFFITLPDGTELTCEYRVIVDKRIIPLDISFTDNPLAGYHPIACGGEEYFDLVNEPDGTFRLYYSFQNTSSSPITVRAETNVVGGSTTGILDLITLEAGAFGFHGPSFNLAAGDIYTILTTFFITLEDGSELTCQYQVIVDMRSMPIDLIFSHDPPQGYHPIDCGGEEFFDLTNSEEAPFLVYYTFTNTTNGNITVRAETTVVGSGSINILNPVTKAPGESGSQFATFTLAEGELHTILTTFFITLEDGTEITCEHTVIVDKRKIPISVRFTDNPAQGYDDIECGDEAFFDLVNEPDGTFSVHYSFRNTSDGTIVVRAETTVIGGGITNILNPVTLEPGDSGYQGATFHLDAGDIYTLETTFFITFADGSEITCVHTVIVDKRSIPIELGFSLDPSEGYELIECGNEEFIDLTDTPDGITRLYFRLENVSPTTIDVNIELTVIEQNSNSTFPLVPLDPGDIRTYHTGFNLEAGSLYTIIYEIFITLPDGTEITCEHRVIIDKRMQPLDIIFSHDPAQGFESIECGGEKFFDLSGTPTGPFQVYYTFTNNTSNPITVRAESMIVGDNYTNILQPIMIDPGDGSSQFATFQLDAGDIYTIQTTFFITFEDGSEITCQHNVVVDKRTEVKPPDGDTKGYQAPSGVARLFPTVAQSQITLETTTEQKEVYRILNSLGQVVETGTVPEGVYRTHISTDHLSAGQYFLRIGQDLQILRFIISKN